MGDHRTELVGFTLTRLVSAFSTSPVNRDAVNDAVTSYVDEMKQQGASVERIMVDIKRIAELEDGPLARALFHKDYDEHLAARQLVEDALTWCVDHYYCTEPE